MSEPTTALPFVLWHRPNAKHARWRIVGRCRTHLEAVMLMSGSGEYRIEERAGSDDRSKAGAA